MAVNPTTTSKNLGVVKALYPGSTPPSNINMIWADTSTPPVVHKFYNILTLAWEPIGGSSTPPDLHHLYDAQTPTAKLSVHVDNRTLMDTDGSTISINWDTGILYDAVAVRSENYKSRILYDNVASTSIDWNNRLLVDAAGATSVDYRNRILKDATGNNILNWSTRQVKDEVGTLAISWGTSYGERSLHSVTGATTVDWANCFLASPAGYQIVWGDAKCYKTGSIATIDWAGNYLISSGGYRRVQWDNMILSSGNVLTGSPNSLDWGNRRLCDGTGNASLDWLTNNTVKILTGSNIQHMDTYLPASVLPTTQTPSTSRGYGDATIGVLGQPTGWFKIKDSGGTLRNVPYYA